MNGCRSKHTTHSQVLREIDALRILESISRLIFMVEYFCEKWKILCTNSTTYNKT